MNAVLSPADRHGFRPYSIWQREHLVWQVQQWTEDNPDQSSLGQPGLQQSQSVRSAAAQASDALQKVARNTFHFS